MKKVIRAERRTDEDTFYRFLMFIKEKKEEGKRIFIDKFAKVDKTV
jgi:hypothetical protein